MPKISVILPAHNEAEALETVLPRLLSAAPAHEVIVVDDGSTDATASVAERHGVRLIRHPYCTGNGAAVKSGARAATGDILVFMDADGQHDPADIPRLVAKLEEGYDMVVGARESSGHASWGRRLANFIYSRFASVIVGRRIPDLTSGFRAVRRNKFVRFLYLLPNGFSYPTTITMAFFRSGFPVSYVPIHASMRTGKSKIKAIKDGARFLLIIVKIGSLYSPMRVFLPVSLGIFLIGVGYYLYTFLAFSRFTNMSAVLILSAVTIFMIGIVSEQVSSLHYRESDRDAPDRRG